MRDVLATLGIILGVLTIGLCIALLIDNNIQKTYCTSCDIHYDKVEYVYCPRCAHELIIVKGNAKE